MSHNILRFLFILFLSYCINPPGRSQTEMPDVLQKGNLNEQLNYIEERTRIYDYYRAIREDMWQQIKKNALDTLAVARGEISTLTLSENKYDLKIDSLNKLVTNAVVKLEEAVRTKNSIKVLGMEINKFAYNSVMWIIVAGLAILLAIGFLAFKRNISVTRNTKKDLEELKTEFETYRKQSREAREKMSMEHFNEIRRLRGKGEEPREEGGGRRAGGSEDRAHVSSGAAPASGFISVKAAKEIAKEEGSGLKAESSESGEKNEVRIKDSELNVKDDMTMDQNSSVSKSLGEEAEPQDKNTRIKNESRKPRKRKTQSPEQGSIEL